MLTHSTQIKRDEFFKALQTYSTLSKSSKKMMALVLIDIENFDEVSRQFGFEISEVFIHAVFQKVEMIAKFANCSFRVTDSVIALVLPVLESESLLTLAANKVLSDLKTEVNCKEFALKVYPRLGMSAMESDNINTDKLFRDALERLHAAKEKGQEFVLHIEHEENDDIADFSKKFYDALNQNEFELYFQPKVHLLSRQIFQAEALLRWKIDGEFFVPPERIVCEAEKSTESNFQLTKWVVNRALRHVKEWQQDGLEITVSVNVSPTLIHRSDFNSMISDALAIWGVNPKFLVVEITETAFMTKKDLCHENLNTLRATGIGLSIDDFGTGYSSLSYFKDIPASELKIDKSFIVNIMESEQDRNLVRLMIQIAHSFDLHVVAEGVESKQAYNYLQELGCDYVQGYYIAKPLHADDFKDWMAQGKIA